MTNLGLVESSKMGQDKKRLMFNPLLCTNLHVLFKPSFSEQSNILIPAQSQLDERPVEQQMSREMPEPPVAS